VQVYDAGEYEGLFYIAMELVEGENLREIVNARGPFSEGNALGLTLQCCRALEAALEKNLIHRDIKPDNVMITGKGLAKVADFGLARDLASSSRITAPGAVIGTPAFMSPEQGQGSDVDHRSDLYSLGATLYFILSGNYPYSGPSPVSIIHKHISDPVPDVREVMPAVSQGCAALVQRLMAKIPGERHQNVGELIPEIEKLLSGPGTTVRAQGTSTVARDDGHKPPTPPPRKKKGKAGSGTLEMPSEALQPGRGEEDRHLKDTAHGFDESGPHVGPTLAEVDARNFRLLEGAARSGPIERGLLEMRSTSPPGKIFLVSKEVIRLGRQGAVKGPDGERLSIDILLRALPCRDKAQDPDNYAKNLTLSRFHASLSVEENLVALVNRKNQGLSLEGKPAPVGQRVRLPEAGTLSLSRGALLLEFRIYPSVDSGRLFRVEGNPVHSGEGLLGMEGSGKISAVRITRPSNASEHGYVVLLRRAGIGEGDQEAIRVSKSGKGAWIYRFDHEYFAAPKEGGPTVSVNGRSVESEVLAPLVPGAVLRVGEAELTFRLPSEDDFKVL
ncbi:MAG: serine/threonine protein kinase, partial [Planctomycetota bacterium]|jgi:hypothetical protein